MFSALSWTSRRRDRERRGWLGVGGGGWWGRMKNEELIPNGTDEKSTATVSIPVASSKFGRKKRKQVARTPSVFESLICKSIRLLDSCSSDLAGIDDSNPLRPYSRIQNSS
ncbi:hypothetical protein OUZ56_013230 [Daphnia magna]|uniref:Uncharacterized protein n=1 Tax=Daphnia magna TaxID=35525 RepID=A0ABQ9Z595_9CRUS|nr:hypothetical protein OUZ56_013230 [Daphnia magna]